MVIYAQGRVPGPTWEVVDAQALPYSEGSFDRVVCEFGVMFLPDRVAAYRGVRSVLTAGGSFLFTVWDTLDTHVVEAAVIDAMAEFFPQDPPGFLRRVPHGYADPDQIRADIRGQGSSRWRWSALRSRVVHRRRQSWLRDTASALRCGSSSLSAATRPMWSSRSPRL